MISAYAAAAVFPDEVAPAALVVFAPPPSPPRSAPIGSAAVAAVPVGEAAAAAPWEQVLGFTCQSWPRKVHVEEHRVEKLI